MFTSSMSLNKCASSTSLTVGPVEPFDEPVLARLARLYVLYLDILDLTIVDKDPGQEFRSVVDPYGQWLAMDLYGLPEILHHPYPGHGEVPLHAECLTVEIVHQVEDPKTPSRDQAVGHEVRGSIPPWGHREPPKAPLSFWATASWSSSLAACPIGGRPSIRVCGSIGGLACGCGYRANQSPDWAWPRPVPSACRSLPYRHACCGSTTSNGRGIRSYRPSRCSGLLPLRFPRQFPAPARPQSFFSMISLRIRWSKLKSAYIALSLLFSLPVTTSTL